MQYYEFTKKKFRFIVTPYELRAVLKLFNHNTLFILCKSK